MMSCKEATHAVCEGLDRRLPLRRRIALRLHVMMCGLCRAYLRQVQALDALVRRRFREGPPPSTDSTQPALPSAARERLKAALRERQSGP
ncbi:MAG: hypothetical protein ACUVYA_01085 [Planctomycetota bacterium]